MTKKIIAYVSPNTDNCAVADQISKLIDVKIVFYESLQEILPLLSTLAFNADLLVIDIEKFHEMGGSDIFDIINTISTLINCTVFRIEPGKPQKRKTVIASAVGLDTDPLLIKQALSTNINGLYPRGAAFSLSEKTLAVQTLLEGNCHIPAKISELLKPKKKVKLSKGIDLTNRQEQILTLIKERGSSNKMIARTLNISESTVKLHVSLIFKKFGVKNRTQLAVFSKV